MSVAFPVAALQLLASTTPSQMPDEELTAAAATQGDAATDATAKASVGVPLVGRLRLLLFAFLGEGALLAAGLLWILWGDLPFALGEPVSGTAVGLFAAVGLAAVQYVLLHYAPAVAPVRALRRLYRELLFPLFRRSTLFEILIISLLAGVGEELFFRGAMQPEWGLIAASLIFGACHVGGRITLPLGIWAACTGALLGGLLIATGGLIAPTVAHAAYDVLALSYLRWGPAPDDEDAPTAEEPSWKEGAY